MRMMRVRVERGRLRTFSKGLSWVVWPCFGQSGATRTSPTVLVSGDFINFGYNTLFIDSATTAMASIFKVFPQLRTVAPRLSQKSLNCKACLRTTFRSNSTFSSTQRRSVSNELQDKSATRIGNIAWKRQNSTIASAESLGDAVLRGAQKSKSKAFPEVSDKKVAYWLLGSAASVFGIVVFGGLTRLTESG